MASHTELAYTGIVDTLNVLEKEFTVRKEAKELVGSEADD